MSSAVGRSATSTSRYRNKIRRTGSGRSPTSSPEMTQRRSWPNTTCGSMGTNSKDLRQDERRTLRRLPGLASVRLAEQVAAVPVWWHSIDLGDGVVTHGHKSRELLANEWANLRLGGLRGKSVLDLGAWDG